MRPHLCDHAVPHLSAVFSRGAAQPAPQPAPPPDATHPYQTQDGRHPQATHKGPLPLRTKHHLNVYVIASQRTTVAHAAHWQGWIERDMHA